MYSPETVTKTELSSKNYSARLENGAKMLGQLFLNSTRCISRGFSLACSCDVPTAFCDVKTRWHLLWLLAHPEIRALPDGFDSDPFAILGLMSHAQIVATRLTLIIQTPAGNSIRIGPKGTNWKTWVDIVKAGPSQGAMEEAAKAVTRIQGVFEGFK